MATLRKITLNWEIRTGAITCDTGYIKRQELCDVDLYVTVDGTPYALDTSWALNLSIKPALLGDNAALVAVTTWTASATTGLYQATAQTIGGTALDTYLAANNADTTDDEGNKLVDLDVYYTVSMAMQAKSDTVTVICKPDVGRADDTVPATIVARNDFLVTNGTGLLVNVAAGYAANGAFVAAQASLAITNATNYIEVTAAGVASVNTTAFTAGSYPLATVVASAGAITANTDLRAWITPHPAADELPSQTGNSGKYLTTNGTAASWGTVSTGLTVGTTAIASGTSGRILYDNAGVLGELPVGTGVATALAGNVGSAGAFITFDGDAGTPSALVGTNISGTASGLTAGNATLAATVTVANEATDTTCFPLFATAATGSLAALSNAGLTFNSATGLLSATGMAGAFNGTVGATTPDTVAGTSGTFSDAVSTSGANATISTSGSDASLYTTGADAHIYTTGANATIQTRTTFRLSNGTYTTTLSHAPSADRAIALPNAAGTLALTSDITGGTLAGSFTTLTASATTSLLLGTAGSAVGNIGFRNATSGTTTLAPATGALGTGTVTLPLSGTLATLEGANTFTGANVNSTAGAASLPAMRFSGVPFAGTGTTSFPLVYINDANATASTTLNTAGTYFGVNGDGTQDLMNLMTDGVSKCKVTSTGSVQASEIKFGTKVLGQGGTGELHGSDGTSFFRFGGTASATIWGAIALGSTTAIYGANASRITGIVLKDTAVTEWNSDTTLSRSSAGVLQLGTGTTANALGSLLLTNLTTSGTLSVTGTTTLSAALITTPEALAPALNAGITVSVATVATGFALNGTNAATLANGTNGQIKTIVCTAVTAAGTATLTPTTCTGYTTVAFTAAGQTLTLQYFTTGGWVILSVRGATPA